MKERDEAREELCSVAASSQRKEGRKERTADEVIDGEGLQKYRGTRRSVVALRAAPPTHARGHWSRRKGGECNEESG